MSVKMITEMSTISTVNMTLRSICLIKLSSVNSEKVSTVTHVSKSEMIIVRQLGQLISPNKTLNFWCQERDDSR